MARRDITRTQRGHPFAVEWPEYHVDCRALECPERALMTATGVAMNWRKAEQYVREHGFEEGGEGWLKRGGFWYCPQHIPPLVMGQQKGEDISDAP